MKRLAQSTLLAALVALALAAPASASFGVEKFEVAFTNKDVSPAAQAGSHPFEMTTSVFFNSLDPQHVDGEVKDFTAEQVAGLVADPTAVPRCSTADFLTFTNNGASSQCSDATVLGWAASRTVLPVAFFGPVFNLVPPPGVLAKIGFLAANTPVAIELGLKDAPPYNGRALVTNLPQSAGILASVVHIWGNPADPVHDSLRGNECLDTKNFAGEANLEPHSLGDCPTSAPKVPFLTLPRACDGPLATTYQTDSWQAPGLFLAGAAPGPLEVTGCSKLGFSPSIGAQPTTRAATSPTGLDFGLDVHDEGLTSPAGLAHSDIKKTVVTLPEGFSTNPSIAEGLNVCSQADLARETAKSEAGAGCPNASKIGTVEVETPLLEETVNGSLYIAKPYENEFNSLLALYIVIKSPKLGIIVKQAAKVTPDPLTGRLVTSTEGMPQLPFSHFRLHFREGTRSPLASPPGCGTYNATAVLTPYAGGAPITTSSAFQIITGPNAGPCPAGGMPPFRPGLQAGTLNNSAGKYSPFYLRLTRNDGEQEYTRFSIKLPPGITGKLAGIPFCPNAAIAAAKARTGPHGGQEELDNPSCPKTSEVGRTLVGAGVGPSLAYAPGKVYLAGPYNGSALSLAAITAAKVGPFDLGTVVIRQALRINPETAEVFIDPTGSDPIPHIIKGIPVHARDIRAYVERPDFVLNPTSCERTSTASTVLGSGLDFSSAADDQPVTVTSPFQAADCASLAFKPKLAFSLEGGTKRGDNPAFKAVLTYPKGGAYANVASARVTLPHSEFLDQSHIKTICTRAQFNSSATPGANCPQGSIYGYAKAITPLLDEPVQGPVFLRSSSNPLPDLVAALHSGKIDVNLVGRIDSVKGGQIRNTFALVPDAPVTKFTLTMQGGKKGLLVNSTNLCKSTNRALADFTGQNGKRYVSHPALVPRCGGAKR
jgi:hypothetical protein